MKLLRRGNGKLMDVDYINIKSRDWKEFCDRVEQETSLEIDSASKHSKDGWFIMYDEYGNEFEGEYTKYSDGEYQFLGGNLAYVGKKD